MGIQFGGTCLENLTLPYLVLVMPFLSHASMIWDFNLVIMLKLVLWDLILFWADTCLSNMWPTIYWFENVGPYWQKFCCCSKWSNSTYLSRWGIVNYVVNRGAWCRWIQKSIIKEVESYDFGVKIEDAHPLPTGEFKRRSLLDIY